MPTYYEILGLAPDCSQGDVKRAYHELAKAYHPDLNSSGRAQEIMRSLNEAYEVLSDPQKRAEYDDRLRMMSRSTVINNDEGSAVNEPVDYGIYEEEVRRQARRYEEPETGKVSRENQDAFAVLSERAYSFFLDMVIGLIAVPVAYMLALSALGSPYVTDINTALFNDTLLAILFLISVAYSTLFEGSVFQATLGKVYFKLVVRGRDGRPITMRTAALRSVFKASTFYIALYLLVSGYLLASICIILAVILLLYLRNWTLHDFIAGTSVAKKPEDEW